MTDARCEPPEEWRDGVARAVHDGMGDGWAYTNYAGDEWRTNRDMLNAAAVSVWKHRKQESNGEFIGRALWEQHDALTALRAEVEKLRGALTTIRDAGLGPDRGSAQWTVDLCRNLARAALKETTP